MVEDIPSSKNHYKFNHIRQTILLPESCRVLSFMQIKKKKKHFQNVMFSGLLHWPMNLHWEFSATNYSLPFSSCWMKAGSICLIQWFILRAIILKHILEFFLGGEMLYLSLFRRKKTYPVVITGNHPFRYDGQTICRGGLFLCLILVPQFFKLRHVNNLVTSQYQVANIIQHYQPAVIFHTF